MSKWTRRSKHDEELIRMAGQDVPMGSGLRILGKGRHRYIKTLRADGSTTIFCFRTHAEMQRAIAEGIANDTPIGEHAQA